jgi:tetratricopeptide (TPR) repeat protein
VVLRGSDIVLLRILAPEITWTILGRGRIAGTYRRINEVGRLGSRVDKGQKAGLLPLPDENPETVIATCDDVLARSPASPRGVALVRVVEALLSKGEALSELSRFDEALACYDEVVGLVGDVEDVDLLSALADALGERARVLLEMERFADADAVIDQILARFADNGAPRVRRQVALALYNRVWWFYEAGRYADVVVVAEVLAERFGGEPPAGRREILAEGLWIMGDALGELGLSEQALAGYDAAVERYGWDQDAVVRKAVAQALNAKAELLDDLGRSEEAVDANDVVGLHERARPDPRAAPRVKGKRRQRGLGTR